MTPVTTSVGGVLRRLVLVVCLGLLAGACSGDDDVAVGTSTPTSPAPTGTVPEDECKSLQVLLKLDVTAEEQAAVEEKVHAVKGVTASEVREVGGDDEPDVLLVTTASEAASNAVAEALAGDPAVVSVVHPEQVC